MPSIAASFELCKLLSVTLIWKPFNYFEKQKIYGSHFYIINQLYWKSHKKRRKMTGWWGSCHTFSKVTFLHFRCLKLIKMMQLLKWHAPCCDPSCRTTIKKNTVCHVGKVKQCEKKQTVTGILWDTMYQQRVRHEKEQIHTTCLKADEKV